MSRNNPPELFVLAGPNGAGKSTAAAVLLPTTLGINQFVNADNIAAGLSPFAPESAAFLAGRLMLHRVRELCDARASFGIETTLSGKRYVPFLREASEAGYLVSIVYLWLHSADLAVSRVADRVSQGGHSIPEETIRRRYNRGLVNLVDTYCALADSWTLCDNSGSKAVTVVHGSRIEGTDVLDANRNVRFQECVAHARQKG